jgi:hypothetical protein
VATIVVTRDGIVIGGDSRQRNFTGSLASLIKTRDGHRCREPFCDAPIRHIDHIRRWTEGTAVPRSSCCDVPAVRWRAMIVGVSRG